MSERKTSDSGRRSIPFSTQSANSRPPWNSSTTVDRKSGMQILPGKKKKFFDIQNRINPADFESAPPAPSFSETYRRHRNDSSGVAACIYTKDHQSPWPAPKQLSKISSTEFSEERKHSACD